MKKAGSGPGLPRGQRAVPRSAPPRPRSHRVVPRGQRVVPRSARLDPRSHRVVPRTARNHSLDDRDHSSDARVHSEGHPADSTGDRVDSARDRADSRDRRGNSRDRRDDCVNAPDDSPRHRDNCASANGHSAHDRDRCIRQPVRCVSGLDRLRCEGALSRTRPVASRDRRDDSSSARTRTSDPRGDCAKRSLPRAHDLFAPAQIEPPSRLPARSAAQRSPKTADAVTSGTCASDNRGRTLSAARRCRESKRFSWLPPFWAPRVGNAPAAPATRAAARPTR